MNKTDNPTDIWNCLLIICVPLFLALLIGFTHTYNTNTPLGTDDPREADDRMREIKAALQERMAAEHNFPLTGTEVSDSNAGTHSDITCDSIKTVAPWIDATHADHGLSTSGSATDNATALLSAITAAFTAGGGVVLIPPGVYSCNPVKYTKTDTDSVNGIIIRGISSSASADITPLSMLDFSGFSNTGAQVGIEIDNTGAGQIIGLTIENLILTGPGNVASNTTKGIYTHGTSGEAGIRHLTLKNVTVTSFNRGVDLNGPTSYPIITNGLVLRANHIGMCLGGGSAAGSHIGMDIQNSTGLIGVYLHGTVSNHVFDNPVIQGVDYGFVLDTQNNDIWGLVFNSPYFESLDNDCFRIGYQIDGTTASGTGHVHSCVWNGGTYTGATNYVFKSSLTKDWHTCVMNGLRIDQSSVVDGMPHNSAWLSSSLFTLELVGGGTSGYAGAVLASYNDQVDVYSLMKLRKSHNDTLGTLTETTDTSVLGVVGFDGIDTTTAWEMGATITATQDGAAGVRVPTTLSFETYSSTAINSNQLVLDGPNNNVGIGTATPATSAKVEISSTTGALLLPRMTTAERDALTAVNGMLIYNTTTTVIEAYENGSWVDI